jgi:hypothetical protein
VGERVEHWADSTVSHKMEGGRGKFEGDKRDEERVEDEDFQTV